MRFLKNGFTLIELLVVVTIIAILLALLMPALDKAIYQAELAVCATQQKNVVNAVSTYALNSRRFYPGPRNRYVPNVLTTGATAEVYRGSQSDSFSDDRPLLRPYFNINMLQCPPAGKVDLDQPIDLTVTPDGSYIHASMDFWFGWKFDGASGGAAMKKLGDRWGWGDQRFNVLVNDVALTDLGGGGNNYTAHPEQWGVFSPIVYNNGGGPFTNHMVWAGWWGGGPAKVYARGPVDLNAAFDDSSVRRTGAVGYDRQAEAGRMTAVPRWENLFPQTYHLVPHP